MATSESAAAGAESGTPGSSIPRAVAVTALTEEPSTGLFPEKPEKPDKPEKPEKPETVAAVASPEPSGSGTPATVSGSAAPDTAEGGEEGEPPQAETEPEAPAVAVAAVTGGATTTSATATESTTAATATAADGSTAARRTGVLPLGRPGKPLIAAAVAGGLVLVGVPFLISGLSGSGDDTAPPSALAPVGSRMGPDGSGPGFVPGRQNAPGENLPKSDGKPSAGSAAAGGSAMDGSGTDGSGTNGSATVDSGTGGSATGGVHEAGTKSLDQGSGKKATSTAAGKKAEPAKSTAPAPSAATGSGTSVAKPAASQQKQAAAAVTYSHFIGPGCNTPGFATSDQYHDSNRGWRGSSGSQTSYGCSGFYYSVPLSNSTTKSTGYAQWKFPTGSVTKGTCQVSVYIPNVKDISYVGGNPAHYTVHRYFQAKPSTQIGTFEINQPSHLGQWINAGTFPVSTGKISVVLDNRGKTSGNRHAAAAPVKVKCTAS